MSDPLAALKAFEKELAAAEREAAALVKLAAEVAEDAKKVAPPEIVIRGLVRAYTDAVKDTGGLTSVRPATLKAVQTAEKTPTPATVKAAVTELGKHAQDVKKGGGKEKKLAAFVTATDRIVTQLEKLLG